MIHLFLPRVFSTAPSFESFRLRGRSSFPRYKAGIRVWRGGGKGGLGVADLGGLVRPVSLVNSAVDVMLALLRVEVVDKVRNAGFE
jgi:hypothetical protein